MPWRKACVAVRVHIDADEHFPSSILGIDEPKLVLLDGKKPPARKVNVDYLSEIMLLARESIEYGELRLVKDLSVLSKTRLVRPVESSQDDKAAVRA